MRITRAVITAAGRGARQYPAIDTVQKAMLPMVDRDGLTKPVLQIIAEEAIESGIEQICLVTAPGDEAGYRRSFGLLASNLRSVHGGAEWAETQARKVEEISQRLVFRVQDEPLGYGHAVWTARDFTQGEPILLLLSDHLYLSKTNTRCSRQLLDLVEQQQCAASAVQPTREHLIQQYGTVSGKRSTDRPDVYQIEDVIEKPNPTLAELRLQVPGVRAGHYLCFFGMHVLTPTVFEILDELVASDARENGMIQLSTALNTLARREKYLALETKGVRHDIGVKFGMIEAQIALALDGVDRDRMLSTLLESVVRFDQGFSG